MHIPHDTHSKVAAETKKNVGTFRDRAGPSGHSRSPRQISSCSAECQSSYGYVMFLICTCDNPVRESWQAKEAYL